MKRLIKSIIFGFFALLMAPVTLLFIIVSGITNKDETLAGFSQFLALLPGKLGSFMRTGFYRFALTQCHPNARISFMVLLSQRDTELGEGIYIGPQCNIGRCRIGNDCLLGSGVHIMSGKNQHNFDDLNTPIRDQGGQFSKVSIGTNCWVGNGALVMANIGDNCIVAAGSVVIDDIPSNVIVAGNPAKIIRTR